MFNKILGILGSLFLIYGAYLPLLKIATIGEISYMQYGVAGDGIFLIIIGVISFIISIYSTRINYFMSLLASALMLQLFISIQNNLADVNEGYLVGWLVIFAGIVLLFMSGYFTKKKNN